MPPAATKTIDHATLAEHVTAGTVLSAHVIGQPGGWGIVVKEGSMSRTLAARRGSARVFRRLETLVVYLKRIGLDRFEIDASGYPFVALSRRRPKKTVRTESANETADHDRWFRLQVKNTVDRVERGEIPLVTDDEHRAGWRHKRVELLSRLRRDE
jgi:hypothetical protein